MYAKPLDENSMTSEASLDWIRSEAERYVATITPIQSVLQVIIESEESMQGNTLVQQRAHQFILDKLKQRLANVAPGLGFYSNPRATESQKDYITKSTYSDFIKAQLLEKFFQKFNAQHQQHGKVYFILSRPLIYSSAHDALPQLHWFDKK